MPFEKGITQLYLNPKMNKIRYVWHEFISRESAIGFGVLLLITLVIQGIGLIPSYLVGELVNGFEQNKGLDFALLMVGLFFVCMILNTGLSLFKEWYDLNKVTFRFVERFQSVALKKLRNRPLSFFMKSNTLEQIKDIDRGFDGLRSLIFGTFFWFVPTAMMIILTCIVLFFMQPVFGGFAVLIVAVYILGISFFWKVSTKHLGNWMKSRNRRFGEYSDLIRNTPEIKLTGAYEMHESYERRLFGFHKYSQKLWWVIHFLEVGAHRSAQTVLLFAIITASYFVIQNTMSIGEFTVVFLWLQRIVGNIANASSMIKSSVRNIAAVDRLINLLKEDVNEIGGKNKLNISSLPIRFEDTSFSYSGKNGRHALKGLSLKVEPGKFTALVGASGSGKSTIFKMLMQGIEASGGAVFIGDTSLSDISHDDLHSQISTIPQEKMLFNTTLRQNVLLGLSREEFPDEKIAQVFQELGLSHLTKRLHLSIGENGKKLSGGERQRVLFARVMLDNRASLILLDEPTSDLDSESEQKVRNAIRKMCEAGKTVFMIAHRLTIVQDADRVYLLKEGRVEDGGNHAELLERSDAYRGMVRNQTLALS